MFTSSATNQSREPEAHSPKFCTFTSALTASILLSCAAVKTATGSASIMARMSFYGRKFFLLLKRLVKRSFRRSQMRR